MNILFNLENVSQYGRWVYVVVVNTHKKKKKCMYKNVYILVLVELFLQKRAHIFPQATEGMLVEELLQNYTFFLIKSMILRGSNLSIKI